MAPNPQHVITERENPVEVFERPLIGDEVVISGISGVFPKSENTMEFMENLYNKVDMVEEVENCASLKHPSLPKHYGKLKNLDKFDAQFFRVTPWQAASLDPLSRKVMENAFSAIYDSGINPLSLSGTKLGVFMGSSFSDIVIENMYDTFKRNIFIISGCSKTMMANRVSYWIDGKGPSFALDQACASSISCLEVAYNSLKRGDCDSAIIGGCNVCINPALSLHLKIAGHVCIDGKTKCFDKNGDGYVRAEAVSILFLQKAKDAKRIYAEICGVKSKYFTRPDANFLPIRSSEDLEDFLKEFYASIKVNPAEVEYVEGHGIGIAEADGNELDAIGNIFGNSRAVKVGSIKSNMGNAEAASGICSLIKLCLSYYKGELFGNLHYNDPQDHIPAVRDGKIQVLTENTPFSRRYTALNNFSFTGSNFHVLLKGHYKRKNNNLYKSSIPRLVVLSGRDEVGVKKTISKLNSNPIDPEQIALLHNIYKVNFPSHTGRGYTILDTNENNNTISLASSFEIYPGTTRPVCFLYSGMGSQWNEMGTELLRIPIFAAAIERCHKVLQPLGLDIVKIITDTDITIFDNILHSMVGISAIQIGLTDILTAMGIVPDKVIGHSVGELGCAYADKCFSAEEMILSSYYRGLISSQATLVRGSMAAVGLGYNDILPLCPPEIEVACHNSSNSSTISGPADIMKQFVSELTARGIFAREVACANIAYHSKYIAAVGPALLSAMKQLIKEPKLRSEKWISTSVPQEKWNQEIAKYSSPDYFTNNLLSPVLFEENSSLIPKDAVVIEIAPHGLLQAIVKKSHSECVNIPLTKRADPDPILFFLKAVGKMYETGLNPQIDVLYPKVEFPVATETPMLSHLVEWEHSVNWPLKIQPDKGVKETATRDFVISVYDDEYEYLKGHVRNGINEVPESALLVFVWETLGMYRGKYYKDMSVTFYDVTFHCPLKIENDDLLRLRVTVQDISHRFEIYNGKTHIMTGFVKHFTNVTYTIDSSDAKEDDVIISGHDFYKILRMKGYFYGNDFQLIQSLNNTRNTAYVKQTEEWALFLDSLLQLNASKRDHNGISIPKIIQNLSIDVYKHKNEETIVLDGVTCYKVQASKSNALVRCGGVQLKGVIFDDKPTFEKQPDVLLTRQFVPHELEESINQDTAISINLQLVADNVNSNKIKVLELVNSSSKTLSHIIQDISAKYITHQCDVNVIEVNNDNAKIQYFNDVNLVICHDLLANKKILSILNETLQEDLFVLTFEKNVLNKGSTDLKIITTMQVDEDVLILLKKETKRDVGNVYISIDNENEFSWINKVNNELEKSKRVVLVSEREPYCGLFGVVKYLKEMKGNKIGAVIVDDYHASLFNPQNSIYKEQLEKNLTFNVLKKGQWGSYYNVPNKKLVKLQNVSLTNTSPGDLDNFSWLEIPKHTEHLVKVSFAGLSARDCQKALGEVTEQNTSYGMDFSGIDSKGYPVMGLVANGALSTEVEADPTLFWPVPQHWSLQDAATVPLPYIHAYYILVMKGEIKPKQRVFITGGAGALGQAVISICHSLDCTVFTTVSDEKKKKLLLKLFPKLKDENILYSRHEHFFSKVIDVTKNKRCDIVINCSSGQLRKATMKCVGFLGIFIDVGNEDIYANNSFEMSYLEEDRQYKVTDLSTLFRPENIHDRKGLQILMADGIAKGIVKPLSRVIYSPSEVSRAFKLVSSSRHCGRALIRMSDSKSILSNEDQVVPRMLYSNGVQIVVCDTNNLAVELVDHLIKKQTRKIVLNLKKDQQTSYLYAKAASWKKMDVTVELNLENLQTKEGCDRLLKVGRNLGPVSGIFIVQNYNENTPNYGNEQAVLTKGFNEMVLVAANLDMVSRNYCSDLSNFVVVSLCEQNIGSNYATSVCERICEGRQKIGLPALILRANISNEVDTIKASSISYLELPSLSSLFTAMDISLKLNYNNAQMFNLSHNVPSTVAEKLGKTLGVKNIVEIDETLTLKEMELNDMMFEEIKSKLRPVTYTDEEIQDMTIASLKQLYNQFGIKKKTNFNESLGVFYRHLENDEYSAFEPVINMKTQLTVMPNEINSWQERCENHLMIIPGFDGRYQVFETIAERLKIRAATLQLGPDVLCESIPKIAESLVKHIKVHFKPADKFYILGYSFGVNVALEIARLLEAEGRTGVVYCLDSSPDALKAQLNAYIGCLTDTQLQNIVLTHMYSLMVGQESIELKQELEKTDIWSNKLEICLRSLRSLVKFSHEHRRTILESAYKRILLAREYEPNFRLRSDLVLIRGIPHPKAESLAEDYGLSKYSKQPVKLFHIESDHAAAPYDYRVSNIVNKMLDSTLLEEFKYKNLCEFYLQ